tara:strand:- start:61 stop:855 length:795 start_codon:yes stop_codon:yes gene_type:complete
MPSKTGKAPAEYYKNDLTINQASNTGIDATTRLVHDGAGQSTAISLSDDVLSVQPVNDDTVGTMLVKNQSGSVVFSVDTSNSKVLIGASNVAANTQYAYFGASSSFALSAVAGTHYAVPFGNVLSATVLTMGTGTDPSTSYDISVNNNADDMTMMLWYIPDNITVDQVHWMAGGSAATGDTINIHLLSFDFDAGVGVGKGDLSNGVVVAGSGIKVSLGYENVIYDSIAPASADVDAGKVCMVTFESDGTNSDYSINVTVKYHIR